MCGCHHGPDGHTDAGQGAGRGCGASRVPIDDRGIAAGIILGPTVFGLVHFDDTISLFADLGIIALLFISGAEINLRSFSKAKRVSAATAVAGVILPFVLGVLVAFSSRLILSRCCSWA